MAIGVRPGSAAQSLRQRGSARRCGRYWTTACAKCVLKSQCTTGPEQRITRWEHEHILEAVQRRLDEHPEKMRQRRETVEHPFGTIKARMGATHFLMKTSAKGRRRDGAARARLQSHARHEHHRRPTAHGDDEGIVAAEIRPSAIAEPPRTAEIRISSAYSRKSRHIRKNDRASPHRRGRDTSMLCHAGFYTTKTLSRRLGPEGTRSIPDPRQVRDWKQQCPSDLLHVDFPRNFAPHPSSYWCAYAACSCPW